MTFSALATINIIQRVQSKRYSVLLQTFCSFVETFNFNINVKYFTNHCDSFLLQFTQNLQVACNLYYILYSPSFAVTTIVLLEKGPELTLLTPATVKVY